MADNDSLHQIVLTRRESEDIQARLILRSLKRGERRCRSDKSDRKLW